MRKIVFALIGLSVAILLFTVPAQAQATRTWVSGVGDDANPCSRTAPCKTFAGAISKTAPAGEINVLDPGGFGAVTITKSISIIAEGTIAGVLVSGTNGIIISAAAGDVVTLRGLNIDGLNTGLSGIKVLTAKAVHVENCRIWGFQQGIDFESNVLSAQLEVKDAIIRDNSVNGILVLPGAGGSAKVSVDNTIFANNTGDGFKSDATNGAISATLRESTFVANGGNGVHSFSPGATASLIMLDHCSLQNHSSGAPNGNGIFSDTGAGSIVSCTDNTISGNRVGGSTSGGATIFSFGNNHNAGNGTPGSPNP